MAVHGNHFHCIVLWPFNVFHSVINSAAELLDTNFLSTPSSACSVGLIFSVVWYLNAPPPPSFPLILLQSCHPHQHVSGAVWVSIKATGHASPSHWMPFNTTSFGPGSPHPKIVVTSLHVACLPVCLIYWLNMQPQSPFICTITF